MMIGADDTVDAITLRSIEQHEAHGTGGHESAHDGPKVFLHHGVQSSGMNRYSVMYSLAIVAAILAGPHGVDSEV